MNNNVLTFRPISFSTLLGGFIIAALISMFVVQVRVHKDHKNVTRETIADNYQQQFNIKLQLVVAELLL
ncbi:MAG: hypothetical protein CMQ33_03975 [Gammaproteobacteria bacterium]|jgi:hypothetical protein|nr:hypothetical protein [Gammaproteobacteria bacterium]